MGELVERVDAELGELMERDGGEGPAGEPAGVLGAYDVPALEDGDGDGGYYVLAVGGEGDLALEGALLAAAQATFQGVLPGVGLLMRSVHAAQAGGNAEVDGRTPHPHNVGSVAGVFVKCCELRWQDEPVHARDRRGKVAAVFGVAVEFGEPGSEAHKRRWVIGVRAGTSAAGAGTEAVATHRVVGWPVAGVQHTARAEGRAALLAGGTYVESIRLAGEPWPEVLRALVAVCSSARSLEGALAWKGHKTPLARAVAGARELAAYAFKLPASMSLLIERRDLLEVFPANTWAPALGSLGPEGLEAWYEVGIAAEAALSRGNTLRHAGDPGSADSPGSAGWHAAMCDGSGGGRTLVVAADVSALVARAGEGQGGEDNLVAVALGTGGNAQVVYRLVKACLAVGGRGTCVVQLCRSIPEDWRDVQADVRVAGMGWFGMLRLDYDLVRLAKVAAVARDWREFREPRAPPVPAPAADPAAAGAGGADGGDPADEAEGARRVGAVLEFLFGRGRVAEYVSEFVLGYAGTGKTWEVARRAVKRVQDGAGSTLVLMPMREGAILHAQGFVADGVDVVLHMDPAVVPERLRKHTHAARAAARAARAEDAHMEFASELVSMDDGVHVRAAACAGLGPGAPGRAHVQGRCFVEAVPEMAPLSGRARAAADRAAGAGSAVPSSYGGDELYGSGSWVHVCTMGHLRHANPEVWLGKQQIEKLAEILVDETEVESVLDCLRALATGLGVILRKMRPGGRLVFTGDVFQLEGQAVRGGNRADEIVKRLLTLMLRGCFTDSCARRRRLAAAGASTLAAGLLLLGVSGPIRTASYRVTTDVAKLVNELLAWVIPRGWRSWYPKMTGRAVAADAAAFLVPRLLGVARSWADHAPTDLAAAVAGVDFCRMWLAANGDVHDRALVLCAYRSVAREAATYVADLLAEVRLAEAAGEFPAAELAAAARVSSTTFVACLGADVRCVAAITVGDAVRHWGLRARMLVVAVTRGQVLALVANDEAGVAVVVPDGLRELADTDAAPDGPDGPGSTHAYLGAVRSAEALSRFGGRASSVAAVGPSESALAAASQLEARAEVQAEARIARAAAGVARPDALLPDLRAEYGSVLSRFVKEAGVRVEPSGPFMRVAAEVGRAWGETVLCAKAGWVAVGHVLPAGALAQEWGGVLTRGAGVMVGAPEGVEATLYGRCGRAGRGALAATVALATACALRWRVAAGKPLPGKSHARWAVGGRGAVELGGEVFAPPAAPGVASVVFAVPAASPRPPGDAKDEAHVVLRVDVYVGARSASGVHVVSVRLRAVLEEDDPQPGEEFWARMGRGLASSYPALAGAVYRVA